MTYNCRTHICILLCTRTYNFFVSTMQLITWRYDMNEQNTCMYAVGHTYTCMKCCNLRTQKFADLQQGEQGLTRAHHTCNGSLLRSIVIRLQLFPQTVRHSTAPGPAVSWPWHTCRSRFIASLSWVWQQWELRSFNSVMMCSLRNCRLSRRHAFHQACIFYWCIGRILKHAVCPSEKPISDA